jgi:hypothetical protein
MVLHPLQIGDSLQHAAAFKRPFDAEMDLLEPDRVMFDQVIVCPQLQRFDGAGELIRIDEDQDGREVIMRLRGL